jgi:type IV pilus assembly protein PilN
MIRVNLLPVKDLEAEVSRRHDLAVAGIALGAMVIVMLGLYLYQSYEMSTLNRELAGLRSEIQVLNTKVKQVGDLQNKIKQFTSKNKIIEDLEKKKVGPVRVMESLSMATPTSLWLTELKETGGKLVLNGLAVDNQTVADFMKALAASSYFREVELVETTQGGASTGPYKKFSIRTTVSYQPQLPPETTGIEGNGRTPAQSEKKS